LLRLTFLDLVLREVVFYEEVEIETIKYKRVRMGSRFEKYVPQYHEKIMTDTLRSVDSTYLTIYEFMKIIKEEIKSSKRYKIDYFLQGELYNYFKPVPSLRIFKYLFEPKLNAKGEKTQKEIQGKIWGYEERLEVLSNDSLEALGILNELGTNVLLMNNLQNEKIKRLFKDLETASAYKKERPFIGGYDMDYSIFDMFILFEMMELADDMFSPDDDGFDGIFGDFDSSSSDGWFDSDSFGGSDGSDSFGGDSGCSGCGGCGS